MAPKKYKNFVAKFGAARGVAARTMRSLSKRCLMSLVWSHLRNSVQVA